MRSIWLGYDKREHEASVVATCSLDMYAPGVCRHLLMLDALRSLGIYWRPTSQRDGHLWDDISAAPMSTEFAISRFLIPQLAGGGWALFADCDILVRGDLDRLFAMADSNYAVMCVKHDHRPTEQTKKDGRLQAAEHDPRFPGVYSRKNWSSVMLFNCDHSANAALTIELVNTVPGRDLHRFCWLDDALIGELPPEWNYLVGHTKLPDGPEPKLVHFTEGGPWLPKYAGVEYADDWRAMRKRACQQWGIPSAKIKAEAEAAS